MNWVNVLAVVSAIIGLISGAKGLRAMRSKVSTRAEISWTQPPLSPWRYETPSMVAITVHSLGLLCLTGFVLFSLTRNDLFAFPPKVSPSLLVSALALLAVFFTTYASGVMIAYHFTQQWISPINYGICNDGMLYGDSLISWKSFSYHEAGPEPGQISLYSSYSPRLRTWVLQPPADSFATVLEVIHKHVPSIPPIFDSIPWQRSPVTLNLEMILLVTGALLPAIWGWMQNRPLVWMYALVAFVFVQYFGIKLITVFDGRGETSGTKGTEESR